MTRMNLVYTLILIVLALDLVMVIAALAGRSETPMTWLGIAMAVLATVAIVIKEED